MTRDVRPRASQAGGKNKKKASIEQSAQLEINSQLAAVQKKVEEAIQSGKLPEVLSSAKQRETTLQSLSAKFYQGDCYIVFDRTVSVVRGVANNRATNMEHAKALGLDMLTDGVKDDENPMIILANVNDFEEGCLQPDTAIGPNNPPRIAKWKKDLEKRILHVLAGHHRWHGLGWANGVGEDYIGSFSRKLQELQQTHPNVEARDEQTQKKIQQLAEQIEHITSTLARMTFFRCRVYSLGEHAAASRIGPDTANEAEQRRRKRFRTTLPAT